MLILLSKVWHKGYRICNVLSGRTRKGRLKQRIARIVGAILGVPGIRDLIAVAKREGVRVATSPLRKLTAS